jgi:hypothetical protein
MIATGAVTWYQGIKTSDEPVIVAQSSLALIFSGIIGLFAADPKVG